MFGLLLAQRWLKKMIGAASKLQELKRNVVPPALALLAWCLWTGRRDKWMTVPSQRCSEKDSYQMLSPASLQWHGEAFGSKALGFRHQTRGKGWGQVSLAETGPLFFLYDRRSPEILRKCIGALIMLVRLCCKVCFSLFSIWVSYCESARCLERMCKEPQ